MIAPTVSKEQAIANINSVKSTSGADKTSAIKNVETAYATPTKIAPVLKPAGSSTSNQSLTTLSSNKSKDILNTSNGLKSVNRGVSTNPESGVATYANGSAFDDKNDTSEEDDQIDSLLSGMLKRTDSETSNTIQSIQNKYSLLKQQQGRVNESQSAATQGALFRSGAAQGDAYANNTMGYQTQQNLQALQSLDMEEEDAINSARSAQSAGYARVAELRYNEALDAKKRKMEMADKINEEMRQQQVQNQKDTTIAQLYDTGIQDVGSILGELNKQGISATAKDVKDSFENTGIADIQKVAAEASANGAPLDIVIKIGRSKSVSEAIAAAGQYTRDPLDVAYKKAQIANVYSTMNARNYSSNENGTINGKPQNATQSAAESYGNRLAESNATIELLGGGFTGKLAKAPLPNFLKSDERQSYEQAKKNFVTAVLRRESGASISPSEFRTAESQYFPQPGDAPSTVEQKAVSRNTVINNFYREGNVPRPVLPGQVIESNGRKYQVDEDGETLNEL